MFKSERRDQKRNKKKKMGVSGAGVRILQRVLETKSKKLENLKTKYADRN